MPAAPWTRHLAAPWVKPVVWTACAVPGAWLWWAGFTDQLGANPAEALIRGLGEWSLRLLCLTLCVTPLRQLTGWAAVAGWRRGLGLWTFAYAAQHALAYAWLDMGSSLTEVWQDLIKRPFILVGALALAALLPLAATSFNRAIRAMGPTRWKRLHRLVYLVAVLAVLHFYWMRTGKNHFGEVYVYGGILAALLGARLWRHWRQPQPRSRLSRD